MKNKTSVIFRTYKANGDVIALFPFIPADYVGWHCDSYMHVGQHGGACPSLVHGATRPSTRAEINPLYKELVNIGYHLRELKRFPRNAYDTRKQALKNS